MAPSPLQKGFYSYTPPSHKCDRKCFFPVLESVYHRESAPVTRASTDTGNTMTIKLTLNGESRQLQQSLTVAELIHQLGHEPRRVAVEVNQEVVPRLRHGEHLLREG